MPKLNDNLDVTINIRWLVKIVVILGLMTSFYYQTQSTFARHENHTQIIEKDILGLQSRVKIIEQRYLQQIEEENKTLMDKVNNLNPMRRKK
tara:strand:+ start:1346 stop:1621 length:276 start_codon:yes stop_codon:yes gene_type:complete